MSDLVIYEGARDVILIIDLQGWKESARRNKITVFYGYLEDGFPAKFEVKFFTDIAHTFSKEFRNKVSLIIIFHIL